MNQEPRVPPPPGLVSRRPVYRGRIVGLVERAEASRELVGLLMAGAVEAAAETGAAPEDEVTVT